MYIEILPYTSVGAYAKLVLHMTQSSKQKGFTIVELLIVVVVIAILAAITILSYNGITQRAKTSLIQSDLASSAKTLELFKVASGSDRYPGTIEEGKLKSSNGVTLGYAANNATSPASFCLYGDNGTSRYMVSSTNLTPRLGTCTITNLVTNPSLGVNQTGWATSGYGTGGVATATRTASVGPTGGYAMRTNWSTAATAAGHSSIMQTTTPIVSGRTYTASVWVRSSQPVYSGMIRVDYNALSFGNTNQALAANTWTRLSMPFTATQDAPTLSIQARINDLTGTTNGLTFDATNYMLTEGDTLYTYADGASSDWSWSGTTGASSSSGPAL